MDNNKQYIPPSIIPNEELTEGVYASSGCWTINARQHQTNLDVGRNNYCFQIDAKHANVSGHGTTYTITITFDHPVVFDSSGSVQYSSGNGTNTLILSRTNGATNPNENIGLGDLYVKYAGTGTSPVSLRIVSIFMTD